MRIEFKRDSAGIAQLLKNAEITSAVHSKAEAVAAETRRSGVEVVVHDEQTDRARSTVTIKNSRGRLLEVRDGLFTRAAVAVGLELRRW